MKKLLMPVLAALVAGSITVLAQTNPCTPFWSSSKGDICLPITAPTKSGSAGMVLSNTTAINGPNASGTPTSTIITGGTSSTADGGAARLHGGIPSATGNGGAATVRGGVGGATSGNGGQGTVTGGAAQGGNGNGGSVVLTGGAANGTGAAGSIIERGVSLKSQGAPAAKTVSATLTAAEVLTGIITVAQGAGAASAQQLPLATAMDTALPDSAAGDAFDFSLINTGAAGEVASVTTNTGWSLVGSMIVAIPTAVTGATPASARFRARKTGTGAWTLYRLS